MSAAYKQPCKAFASPLQIFDKPITLVCMVAAVWNGFATVPAFANTLICDNGCISSSPLLYADSPLDFWNRPVASWSDSQTTSTEALSADAMPRKEQQQHLQHLQHWRHRYEIRLTRDEKNLIVFDQYGSQHVFTPDGDYNYQAVTSNSGTLSLLGTESGSQYQWINGQRVEHLFRGSFPVTITAPGKPKISLYYHDQQLQSVREESGHLLEFFYKDAQLERVSSSTIRTGLATNAHCNASQTHTSSNESELSEYPETAESDNPDTQSNTAEQRCDTQANPVPGFGTIRPDNHVTSIDARPASCDSYFVQYYGTERGAKIEIGLRDLPPYSSMTPTVRSFPIVDFINGNELIVVRSRDLASPSFNDPLSDDALFARLMRDGAEISRLFLEPLREHGSVTATESGQTTTIENHDPLNLTLQLVIRHDMASASHWQQIERARAALQVRYGVRLEVVLIP